MQAGDDGYILCGRKSTFQLGFVCLGAAKANPQFTAYRAEDDPNLRQRNGYQGGNGKPSVFDQTAWGGTNGKPAPNSKPAPGAEDCGDLAKRLAGNLTTALRAELAEVLGLPMACLESIALLGYEEKGPHANWDAEPGSPELGKPLGDCWTFPEMDASGRVIGIELPLPQRSQEGPAGHQSRVDDPGRLARPRRAALPSRRPFGRAGPDGGGPGRGRQAEQPERN